MDRNNNVIRTKPIGITSDDKFPVSYQSANTFFHFVNKFNYLNEMISDKKIYPRYCKESLEYLDLDIKNISVAMKCFCNIPLHMVQAHKKEYGTYCIGLTKEWGLRNNLQPVIYYNQESSFYNSIRKSYNAAMQYSSDDDVLADIGEMTNYVFKYMKPVIGRDLKTKRIKDFTDEKEWGYVPEINGLDFGEIIVEENVINHQNIIESYNKIIKDKGYYLQFDYEDIKYIFVNNDSQRKNMIKRIKKLDCTQEEKDLLITKICIWKEMEGDF